MGPMDISILSRLSKDAVIRGLPIPTMVFLRLSWERRLEISAARVRFLNTNYLEKIFYLGLMRRLLM